MYKKTMHLDDIIEEVLRRLAEIREVKESYLDDDLADNWEDSELQWEEERLSRLITANGNYGYWKREDFLEDS